MSGALDFEVRTARPEELEAIRQMAASSEHAAHWALSDFEQYLHSEASLHRLLLVAISHSEVVGFLVASWLAGEEGGELLNLAVATHARRHGIARALCSNAAAWLSALNVARLDLEVRASNAAAIALYHALGFLPVGRRPRYYQHPEEDALLMRWSFPTGGR